eukprot:13108086-Ditylum_brightwellii.AAC.1
MLGTKDLSWLSMKKFLGKRGIKEDILNFDTDSITPETRKNVELLLKRKSKSFDSAVISRVSTAAAPLAAWVKANLKYNSVLEKIKPLQTELKVESKSIEISHSELDSYERGIITIDKKVTELKENFSGRIRDAELLKESLKTVRFRLKHAGHLLEKLVGERERWQTGATTLKQRIGLLKEETLLSSGFIIYLANASEGK